MPKVLEGYLTKGDIYRTIRALSQKGLIVEGLPYRLTARGKRVVSNLNYSESENVN